MAIVRLPRLVAPRDADPALVARFRAVLTAAQEDLRKYGGGRASGHLFLFDDNDHYLFQGTLTAGEDHTAVAITSTLSQQLKDSSPRAELYGCLIPGTTVQLYADKITSGPGVQDAWEFPIRRDAEYHLLSFAT
jgi:hypothetical protein